MAIGFSYSKRPVPHSLQMSTGLVFGAFCFSDFSFPAQIRQKAVASLHDIAVRRLKISRIPRIRNIAAGTGEGKKFVNLSIRIIFQHPLQIADIRGIHADDVVGALVILPCNLLCVMRHERNVLLAQFIDCPVVRRIADLLTAGGEKHFYHYFISPCFAQKCPCLQGFPWFM